MMIDKLKQWDYYYNKLPLYMRNSYGIQEHFKIFYELLLTLDENEDTICKLFDLLDANYLDTVVKKYDDIDGYDFKFLDMIASIYGINRALNVEVVIDNKKETKSLYLSNKELYIFIKSRIIQNNYDGTFLQAKKYYEAINLPLCMLTSDNNAAECYLYLGLNDNITENIRYLFLANLLTLKSLGITYVLNEVDTSHIGIWAADTTTPSNNNSWDVANWL